MSCNIFLSQCSCEGSSIDLICPTSGSYNLELLLRSSGRKRYYTEVVAAGDNFVLPADINSDSIYELVIKQGTTPITIDGASKWYLKSMPCADNVTAVITTTPLSFEYVLDSQTGSTIDLTNVVVTTDSGDITLTAATITDYRIIVYRNGGRLVIADQYTFNATTLIFTFVLALADEQIIFEFQRIA